MCNAISPYKTKDMNKRNEDPTYHIIEITPTEVIYQVRYRNGVVTRDINKKHRMIIRYLKEYDLDWTFKPLKI